MIIALSLVSLVLVIAASPAIALRIGLPHYYFVKHHIIFLIGSLFTIVFFSNFSIPTNRRLAFLIFIGSLFLLFMTLFIGIEIKGARRWIHLPGFSLQPSEFLKPTFAIVSAWLLYCYYVRGQKAAYILNFILFAIIITILINQPDFGMSFVVTMVWCTQLFLAGLPIIFVIGLIGAGIAGLIAGYFFLPHVTLRIEKFLNPEFGDQYQIQKSLQAFKNGGLWGKGPGQGEIKMYLPDAHADFIFSVAGEEFGILFVFLVVILFFAIFYKISNKIKTSPNLFTKLAIGGLIIQFILQALINIGSSLHIIPTKGMTLPFISYGGSSLLSFGISFGMILAMIRKDLIQYEEK